MSMIRQTLSEPSQRWNPGGCSPFIRGLKLADYHQIANVRIETANPRELKFSDNPGSPATFSDLSRKWEMHIARRATEHDPFPRICPIAIDGSGRILDGNHRAAAAILHSERIPVFLVETQADLDAIAALERNGVYYWPHTYDVCEVKHKARTNAVEFGYGGHDAYLFVLSLAMDCPDERLGSQFYFAKDPLSGLALDYLAGRAFMNLRFDGVPVFEEYCPEFLVYPPKSLEEHIRGGIVEKIKGRAMRVKERFGCDAEDARDAVQRILGGLLRVLSRRPDCAE